MIYLAVLCNPLLSLQCQPESYWFVLPCCAAMYLHMLFLTLSPTPAHFFSAGPGSYFWSASKSVLGSAHEPERRILSSPQAVTFLNTQHGWKFVNIIMCQLTVCCPTDWTKLHNYRVWPSVEISFFKHIMGNSGLFRLQQPAERKWLSLKRG